MRASLQNILWARRSSTGGLLAWVDGQWALSHVTAVNTDKKKKIDEEVCNYLVYYTADDNTADHVLQPRGYARNVKSANDSWVLLGAVSRGLNSCGYDCGESSRLIWEMSIGVIGEVRGAARGISYGELYDSTMTTGPYTLTGGRQKLKRTQKALQRLYSYP